MELQEPVMVMLKENLKEKNMYLRERVLKGHTEADQFVVAKKLWKQRRAKGLTYSTILIEQPRKLGGIYE